MEKIRYFDHAATTATKEEVLKEMLPYFSLNYGNASSMYSIGRKSRKAIEEARQKTAHAIGAEAKEIYFTSCGSESDNLSLKGVAYANRDRGNHIITTKIEHPAVLHTCQHLEKEGYDVYLYWIFSSFSSFLKNARIFVLACVVLAKRNQSRLGPFAVLDVMIST